MAEQSNTTNPSVLPLSQRIEDAFAEITACIDSVQSALRRRQQPQDVHFHRALKACRDGSAAVREVERLQRGLEGVEPIVDEIVWQVCAGSDFVLIGPAGICALFRNALRAHARAALNGDA